MSKTRRTFTSEFKAQAVKFVAERGKSLAEVKRLTMERDILKKATAFIARGVFA